MLLARPETAEHLARFVADGVVDLGSVRVERRDRAAHLTAQNPRYLNAEDQTTLDAMEIAVDVAILDPASEVAVLRGGAVEHPKYRGRRIFGAGINLTHLYRGKIPFIWFLQRDLGFVHKFLRGVARPDELPDDVHGTAVEKPWIAAVDTFAIGGHCQILLTMDYVLAADDAFMTLRRARRASSRAPPTCGCRASPATASPVRRSSMSASSSATARRAGSSATRSRPQIGRAHV